MLDPADKIKAAELVKELRGWSRVKRVEPIADCLFEAADMLERLLDERKEVEVYILEREWLHREG